jgi:hypothetical protein
MSVIDRVKGEVRARWSFGDTKDSGPMALDEAGKRLFVACQRPARILVFDCDGGKLVSWADCAAGAGDVVWDDTHERLYVLGSGVVNVFAIHKDRLRPVTTVTTASGARTGAWVRTSGRLCVGVPGKPPRGSEVWVYRAQP